MKNLIDRCIRRYDHQARLMARMVAKLGLDPTQAYDHSMGIARQGTLAARCFACAHATQCAAWLDGKPGPDRHAFCPNAEAFDRLRAQVPAHA